jgi:hypothetical protein
MAYTPLSIHRGHGRVHMNRFRISVMPPTNRGQVAAIGRRLLDDMPKYMAASTAAVQRGEHPWNGHPTLKFRGVARFRPFSVPVPTGVPGLTLPIPIPARLRDWMIPDVHTDSVGVVSKHDSGFTVQTLKREFEDGDDAVIRSAIRSALLGMSPVVPGGPVAAALAAKAFGNVAVYYNQHHFLAGRRAFRFDWGRHFGYKDGRVVFETVAIERFSSIVFAGSVIPMGTVEAMVRRVWAEMLNRFCSTNGLTIIPGEQPGTGWSKVGNVHYMQTEVADSVAAIRANRHFPTMSAEHQQLLEAR